MKLLLLATFTLAPVYQAILREHFELVYAPDPATMQANAGRLKEIQIVLTTGVFGFSKALIDQSPRLKLISTIGAGYEAVDLDYAITRGIVVTTGAGTNDDDVADHAMALLLAVMRNIPVQDRGTRKGMWRDDFPFSPRLSGKRIGIIGLGRIGQKIALRALGFNCLIGYHTRQKHDGLPYQYFGEVLSLAIWSDALIVAVPGGAETRHMINAATLHALGPDGYLVNIGRGSVIDTAALATALESGAIAGAGLDVYESEPAPPRALIALDSVVLTPHVAGRSHQALQAAFTLFIENARRFAAGKSLINRIS